jgi:hypothetical protein
MEEVHEVDKRRFALEWCLAKGSQGYRRNQLNANFFQFLQSDLFVSGP